MFDSYPRPENDTGIGFHYYPDSAHFTRADLDRWLPELQRLHASWLTLRASPHEAIPSHFLRALRESGIEPVVEIAHEPGFHLERRALMGQASHYVRSGVRYITLLCEPNVEQNWDVREWQQPNLVSRIMRLLLPALESFTEVGLYPLLPPLRPGGDYWDTAFLAAMLDIIGERGSDELQRRLALCIHNYAFNRPLAWGSGGQQRWSGARPYLTGQGEDQRGWRLWEWYDEITRARLGRSLPMISGAGGALLGDQDQPDLPPTGVEQHTERNLALVQKVWEGELPDYLFNQSFWLLCADKDHPAQDQAWFQASGMTLPIVERLQALPRSSRHGSGEEAAPTVRAAAAQPALSHYLLLPSWEWGVSSLHWEAAVPFVQAYRPTVGFNLEEARQARRVTLITGAQGLDEAIAQELREGGCIVDCIPAPDHATLREGFARRAAAARKSGK